MKLKNLIEEVYALGFEDVGEVGSEFYTSAKRALRTVFTDVPEERSIKLPLTSPDVNVYESLFRHSTEDKRYTLFGKAFCFKASGEGEAVLVDENGRRSYKFNSPYTVVRDFLAGEGELTFTGPLAYTVCDLVTYSELTGTERENIPAYEAEREIRINDLVGDFLSYSRLPKYTSGEKIEGARISGGSIYLPYSTEGEIIIFYNRRPRDIDPDNTEEDIDLPECVCHLISLLVASYMWLEDDAERAAYYMRQYRDGIERIRASGNQKLDCGFVDVLRWA